MLFISSKSPVIMQRIPLVEVMHFIFGPHNIPLQGSENSYKYISKCGLNTKIIDVSRIDWSKCGTVPSSYMYSTCNSSLIDKLYSISIIQSRLIWSKFIRRKAWAKDRILVIHVPRSYKNIWSDIYNPSADYFSAECYILFFSK